MQRIRLGKALFVLTVLLAAVSPGTVRSQTVPEVLAIAKNLKLVRTGLGASLIIAKMTRSVCNCDTRNAALGKRRSAKVSDAIISAMMNSADTWPVRLDRRSSNP
ncbi:MAG: hypothetical protein IPK01_08340 [Acidobacteria bacterium]|nr:hypothetical protein [Acidobacteriota bacterium]